MRHSMALVLATAVLVPTALHAASVSTFSPANFAKSELGSIDTGVLETKELVARYSEAEQYAAWAENYLKVRS